MNSVAGKACTTELAHSPLGEHVPVWRTLTPEQETEWLAGHVSYPTARVTPDGVEVLS